MKKVFEYLQELYEWLKVLNARVEKLENPGIKIKNLEGDAPPPLF